MHLGKLLLYIISLTILARTWFFMDLAVVTVDWVLTALAAQQEAPLGPGFWRALEAFPMEKTQGSTKKWLVYKGKSY